MNDIKSKHGKSFKEQKIHVNIQSIKSVCSFSSMYRYLPFIWVNL